MKLSMKTTLYYILLLLFFYVGVVIIQLYTIRDDFLKSLIQENHRTALILSEALKTGSGETLRKSIRFMIDTLFESGEYGVLEVKDFKSGKTIYSRAVKLKCSELPRWFLSALSVSVPVSKELIERADGRFIEISVKKCACSVFQAFYSVFLQSSLLFALFALFGSILFITAVRRGLRSLADIDHQAEEIQKNRFVVNTDPPSSPEFEKVITTMNSLSRRVKDLYEKSTETLREYHDILYLDNVTALYNRRYFMKMLKESLAGSKGTSFGSIAMIRLSGLDEANSRFGRTKVDDFLFELAKRFKNLEEMLDNPIVARLNGSEFALLVPETDRYRTEAIGRELIRLFREVCSDFDMCDILKISIGVCEYDAAMSSTDLLGCANAALAKAALSPESDIVTADYQRKDLAIFNGRHTWRDLFLEAIKKERLVPLFDPVEDIVEKKEVFKCVTFDLKTPQGSLSFDDYIPLLIEMKMVDKYFKYIQEYLIKSRIEAAGLGFEISIEPLKESETLMRFERALSQLAKRLNMPLFVEISEVEIYTLKPIVLENISETLRRSNIRLAIRRFDGSRGDYNHLRFAAPAYVRMDEHEFMEMYEISKNSLISMLITLDIKLILENVRANRIEELKKYGVRYIVL